MLHASNTIRANEREASMTSVFAPVDVELLRSGEEAEVLNFLSQRPIHTVAMASLISDNGLQSPLNRGNFYGCRDINGHLEGVALVGHATLLETVSDRALQALARIARDCPYTHMLCGRCNRHS